MATKTVKGHPLWLVLVVLLAMMPLAVAQNSQPQVVSDGLTSIGINDGISAELEVQLGAETTALLSWTCSACTLEVVSGPEGFSVESHGANVMSIETGQSGTVQMTADSEGTDVLELYVVTEVEDTLPTQRPAPEAATDVMSALLCETATDCIDDGQGHLFSVLTPGATPTVRGMASADTSRYVAFNITQGDTLEWQWMVTTHAVSVSFYHQTDSTETAMETVMTSPQSNAWPSATPAGQFWTAPEDGRFVARITTEAPTAAWTATVVHHPHAPVRSLMDANLSQGVDLIGHDSLTAPFDWSDVHELTLASVHAPATVSVDQLLSGSWVAGTPTNLLPGQTLKVYPYPDVSGGRIKVIESPVFMLQAHTRTFADLAGLEAPSYRPIDNATDNSSWPVINLTTPSTGELTLAVHDTTDTYRMVVDGWSESIHFVQFVLEGDVTGLELQLWDIDQNTGEVLATDITRPVGDQLKIGLQVGRGTHYLQVRFQDAAAATPHLWGEEADARTYTLRPSYSLIDEGEEPWFPPSDDAVFWGGVARWFMGLLFLLPVVYLVVHVKRSQAFAASVAEKKQRLAWYIQRLDSGETSAKETRIDMAKALHAVAQLEWSEGLEAWGPKRLEHRTDDVALAVWSVDERLASADGRWPLVVGVHVINGTWDLAALRFDAPEGQAFEVAHVEPRFLFQGEEVFLDTMGPGHRTYLVVELVGPETRVDVELNGRMDGEPFAAKVPETLER
ncbi:MAG: hypothetical protein VX524_07160 [Candidatus Thermoplasmatota archaeon]|nr:hypothetical protein [Candidatus Thermoplasmatota archaeon]